MTEFTVTGIRYQMGEHLSYEEKDAAATEFVASLRVGRQVLLVFEPDNPGSPNKAIAVYIDYERIGYIADEQCDLVYPMLNEQHRAKGTIVRKDNHVTFFITIHGTSENRKVITPRGRILPNSPLGDSFRMPFTKDENALQLIASTLSETEVNMDNFPEIMQLIKRYVPLAKISICYEDNLWRSSILRKLEHLLDDRRKLGISDDDTKEMEVCYKQVRNAVGDMHRSADHWPERVFINHLETLRKDESINRHLYNKYCETFLDDMGFAEADKNKMASEYNRLCGWLKVMKWSELRNPKKLQAMGYRVNYLGLSRLELYDLYSVLLLIEKLETLLMENGNTKVEGVIETMTLENHVLKKNHHGKTLDVQALHKIIADVFIGGIKYGYEWLSLWRVLNDLRLLEDTKLTAFAEQMNKWYPDAKKPCCADNMGDYYSPYLGMTSFVAWKEEEFMDQKTNKQSISGFRRLYNDCETIKNALKSFLK